MWSDRLQAPLRHDQGLGCACVPMSFILHTNWCVGLCANRLQAPPRGLHEVCAGWHRAGYGWHSARTSVQGIIVVKDQEEVHVNKWKNGTSVWFNECSANVQEYKMLEMHYTRTWHQVKSGVCMRLMQIPPNQLDLSNKSWCFSVMSISRIFMAR